MSGHLSPTMWQNPRPSFGALLAKSLLRGLLGGLIFSVAFASVRLVYLSLQGTTVSFGELFTQAAYSGFLAGLVLSAFFLVNSSRLIQDRTFTVAGFAATFFGLAILTVFFLQLTLEVIAWFAVIPRLVREDNLANQAVLQSAVQERADKLAVVERDRKLDLAAAANDDEKKLINEMFDKEILPSILKDIDANIAEKLAIAKERIRPEPSNWSILGYFLTNGPSNEPQDAGVLPALLGSIYLGLITIVFAVPVGVGAALYLEEYKHEGRLARLIQVNINNLAGVPSVVFGILGGFVFVAIFKVMEKEYSWIAARNLLGGGLTLGLLTLPMVIVAAQEAIRAVPSSLRHGAYALGATKWQVMWTIVLPMARPGILTGTILALSRAIGEAAPLVLFGAQLFVDQNPSLFSRFTALPLQIFNWCDRPDQVWKFNAALASLVLLVVLLSMNAVAILLRNRSQKKMRY